jgi:hypothetical protein
LYAQLCLACAEDSAVPALGVEAGWDLPLRLLGAAHYLVLAGEAPALARAYAGDGDPRPLFHDLLVDRREWLRRFVEEHAVQTNEVQRCFGLLPGFLAAADGRPLDVIELGPSAGLNLCWSSYRYRYAAGDWGPEEAVLELAGEELSGPSAELLATRPAVRLRLGIDLNPVDVTTEDGGRLLQCFVWADQTRRLERLRRAIETLRRDPPELVRGDYVQLLPKVLAERDHDSLTVVFQIASTPYVAEEGRRRVYATLSEAGRDGSLAFLNATRPADTWQGDGYGLELQVWRGRSPGAATRRLVGHLDFHGEWIAWQG